MNVVKIINSLSFQRFKSIFNKQICYIQIQFDWSQRSTREDE